MGRRRVALTGVAALVLLLVMSGCGFRPLYGQRALGTSTIGAMALVEVGPLPGRYGQVFRNFLLDRLTPTGRAAAPRYHLRLTFDTQKEALAIEQDESVDRFNFSLTAKYRLVDLTTNSTVFTGRSRSIAAFNVVRSDYATLVAEQDAAVRVAREVSDDIKLQLAIFFDRILTSSN